MLSAMPTLTYQYVYFASGPHTRQPRSASGPGGFALIQTLPGGTLSSGDTFVASPQPASQTVGGNTFPFSFMNVSGGKDGGVTSFSASAPPASITVASANIVVLVVYAPEGGGPPNGGSGATIDSFDEATGSLFNDTFVTVSPDPGGALTKSGNVDGFVDTANAETITALSPTSPTGVDFVQWLTLPNHVSTAAALAVVKGASPLALAFYKTPPPVVVPPLDPCQEALDSLNKIVEDNDRPRLTVAMFNAIKAQLEQCVADKKLTAQEVNNAINAYLDDLNPPTPPGAPGGIPKA
jgi:hypothetical protein